MNLVRNRVSSDLPRRRGSRETGRAGHHAATVERPGRRRSSYQFPVDATGTAGRHELFGLPVSRRTAGSSLTEQCLHTCDKAGGVAEMTIGVAPTGIRDL